MQFFGGVVYWKRKEGVEMELAMELAIVEDIGSDAKALERILAGWLTDNWLEGKIMVYKDGGDFLRDFAPGRFAVVFLDILLGEGKENGIDVARHIREEDEDQILVFTTTESSFALDGFSVQALDYLVKPFGAEQVGAVMKRVQKAIQPDPYIEIRTGREMRRIPLSAILYAATVRRAVEVHTTGGVWRTYMTFDEAEGQLADPRFVCCSRGVLVNLDQVKVMEGQDFLLYTGERLPISRAKRAEMKEAYTARLFFRSREGGL